ncbi:MAG: tetratricopeptide repeat protein [Planctomycetia bacterium]|nr:tetratricopeptide repeat protein [Planctomycetia bacterium]
MRLQKSNAPTNPPPRTPTGQPPVVSPHPRHQRSWKFWLGLAVLVLLIGTGSWLAWVWTRPDHLREAHEASDRRDFRAASAALKKHLDSDPDDADARLLAARTARREGDFLSASEHLRRYAQIRATDDAFHLETSLLKIQAGDLTGAEQLFATYAGRPDSPDMPVVMEAFLEGSLRVLTETADAKFDPEKDDAAVVMRLHKAAELWLSARPGRADQFQGFLWQGRLYLFTRDQAKSAEKFRAALAIDPEHFEARLYLALALASSAPAEALQHLEILQKRAPADRQIRYFRATAHRTLGHIEEARGLLNELLAANPKDVSALVDLAQLNMDEAKIAEAEGLLHRALELAPNHIETVTAMIRCQQLAGRPAEAERYRKRFAEIEAERNRPSPPKP